MPKQVMSSKNFELTEEYIDFVKVDLERFSYDERLDMVTPLNSNMEPLERYKTYVRSFCELTNTHPESRPAEMTACGFLPVGIEPVMFCGALNKELLQIFRTYDIEIFQLTPSSPTRRGYEPAGAMATSKDIWINKLEAAKFINKPVHNITALDVLEVLIK